MLFRSEESAGRIVVDLDAFLRFTAQLDASLAELEAKWTRPQSEKSARQEWQQRRSGET